MSSRHGCRGVRPAAQVKQQLREPASLLLEEVSGVRSELAKAEESLRAAQERFLRLTADFDNYRKRTVGAHASQAACWLGVGPDSMCAAPGSWSANLNW